MIVRRAEGADLIAVRALLDDASLPSADADAALPLLFVAERDGRLVGAAGIERCGEDGLLRSVVFAPAARGGGHATALVRHALREARAAGIGDVYLLTTTAGQWFPRFGFAVVSRDVAPPAVRATHEFSAACPASAVFMRLDGRTLDAAHSVSSAATN